MKILVVDDSPDLLILLQAWLMNMGHEVATANDGETAWEAVNNDIYQVIVSDWEMPGMNGPGLCKKVREADFSSYIYIILLTGHTSKENLIEGFESGADDFCNKPLQYEELNVRLNSAERIFQLEHSLANKNAMLKSAYDDVTKMHEVINSDLHHASALQRSMLPSPLQGKLSVDWYYAPAIQVGGDTFNYLSLDNDTLVFYLVDVSGHGVSAAMMSIYLNSFFMNEVRRYADHLSDLDLMPAFLLKIMKKVNKEITDNDELDHYFTTIFGVASRSSNCVNYVQAGHPSLVVLRKEGYKVDTIHGDGFPVGLVENAEYDVRSIKVMSGDKLFIYSDGFSDLIEEHSTHDSVEEYLSIMDHASTMQSIQDNLLSTALLNHERDDLSMLEIAFS